MTKDELIKLLTSPSYGFEQEDNRGVYYRDIGALSEDVAIVESSKIIAYIVRFNDLVIYKGNISDVEKCVAIDGDTIVLKASKPPLVSCYTIRKREALA